MLNNVIELENKYFGKINIVPLDNKSKSDYNLFKEIVCNKSIMKTSSMFDKQIAENQEKILKSFNAVTSFDKKCKLSFNKIFTNKNEFIGIIGLLNLKEIDGNPIILDIGYFLKPEYRNKKITSQVSELLIEKYFKDYNKVQTIIGTNLIENKASQKVLLNLGFKFIGKVITRGKNILNIFVLTKKDFENRFNRNSKEEELKNIENCSIGFAKFNKNAFNYIADLVVHTFE